MNKIKILKKAIQEVLIKDKGQIYVNIEETKQDEFGHFYQDYRYELIQDVTEYNIEDLYVKDIWGKINTSLEDAIKGVGSPVEEKLFEVINQDDFEDENEYYEYIAELGVASGKCGIRTLR